MDLVLALHYAGLSVRRIKAEYDRQGAATGETISIATMHNWIQRFATEMRAVQRATKHREPKHMPANRHWGVEATGKQDAAGRDHFIFGIIDCGTRRYLQLKRLTCQTSAALLLEVKLASRSMASPT